MWKRMLSKLTNTKVIISISSTLVIILINLGVDIDNESSKVVIEGVCTVGIILGILNDRGMETTSWNDKKKNDQ